MSYFKGEPKKAMKKDNTPLTVQEVIKNSTIKAIPDRGLVLETCEHFGIRSEFSQVSGTVIAHYFPVHKKGKVVGFLKRDLTVPKKHEYAFTTIGDVTDECDLIGQKECGSGKKLFIVEGQYDYPSLWQALRFCNYNKGRDVPIIPNVVSIGLGTKSAAAHIGSNLDFVNKYNEVVLVFDNDAATAEEARTGIVKGQDAVRQVALILPEIKNVVLDLNDPSEYVVDGRSEELQRKVTFEATEYNVDQVVYGAGDISDITKEIPIGIRIEVFPELMNKLGGLRPAELTIVLAPPKTGKTTLCKTINYHLLLHKVKTLGVYLEEDITKTRQSFVAIHNNVHLPVFRQNPGIIPQEKVQEAVDLILSPEYAMFVHDGTGHIGPKELMENLMWAHIKGAKFAIVDHLSFVFSGSRSKDERKEIDNLLTDLAAFVKQTGMHVIAVAHIARDKNKPKPKNKDGSIKYPYWYEVEESDGRGSGAFEQVCWNLIGIDKEVKEDRSRGLSRIRVLYNREWDRTGTADLLTLNPHTGRLEAVSTDYLNDEE